MTSHDEAETGCERLKYDIPSRAVISPIIFEGRAKIIEAPPNYHDNTFRNHDNNNGNGFGNHGFRNQENSFRSYDNGFRNDENTHFSHDDDDLFHSPSSSLPNEPSNVFNVSFKPKIVYKGSLPKDYDVSSLLNKIIIIIIH